MHFSFIYKWSTWWERKITFGSLRVSEREDGSRESKRHTWSERKRPFCSSVNHNKATRLSKMKCIFQHSTRMSNWEALHIIKVIFKPFQHCDTPPEHRAPKQMWQSFWEDKLDWDFLMSLNSGNYVTQLAQQQCPNLTASLWQPQFMAWVNFKQQKHPFIRQKNRGNVQDVVPLNYCCKPNSNS